MNCPVCRKGKTHCYDSRSSGGQTVVRRRRECKSCYSRFTTYETIIDPLSIKR